MWLLNDSIGWSTGGLGQILKTTTGGQYVGISFLNGEVPQQFKLRQNYPNPFNSQTKINFDIAEQGYFKLEIYDILGRKVNELFNNYLKKGLYQINYNAGDLSTGTYFYRLSTEKLMQVKKFIIIK